MVNEPEFLCDIEKSIKLEFTILTIYLFENAFDLIALAIYCMFSFKVYFIAGGLAFMRLLLLVTSLALERNTLLSRVRKYFIVRKLVTIVFWTAVAVCSFLKVTYMPTLALLGISIIVMFVENCNCTSDVA